MTRVEETLVNMRRNPKGTRFRDLCKVCDFYFGEARQKGSSPRVNIQNAGGMAKAYRVRHVLKAIELLRADNDVEE